MIRHALENLKSEEFALRFSFISNPHAVHRALQRSEFVEKLRSDLRSGVVTEESIRAFCAKLFRELEYGRRFPHELALAAIAVTFETRPTDFAEEFVFDLARLELPELPIAIRVARRACQERLKIPDNRTRVFTFANNETIPAEWQMAPEPRQVIVGETEEYVELGTA